MYGLKCVIRDYVDLLLSMKYQPNVTLIDMAHMVAAHGNIHNPIMFVQLNNIIIASNSFLNFDQSVNEMIEEIVEMTKNTTSRSSPSKTDVAALPVSWLINLSWL